MSANEPNAYGTDPFGQQPQADPFGQQSQANPIGRAASSEAAGAAGASAGQALPSYPTSASAAGSANAGAGQAFPSYPTSASAAGSANAGAAQAFPSYPTSAGTSGVNTNMADPFGQQAAAAYQPQPYASNPYTPMGYPAQAAFAEPPIDQPWYGIDFLNATKRFFTKYATFSGRASRGEYWWAQLGLILLGTAVGVLALVPIVGSIVQVVYGLGIIVPSIALSVRRLHDSNLSGWFLLIPYALQALATVVGLAGFGPLLMKAIEDPTYLDYMTDAEATEVFMPMLGGLGIALLIGFIGMVVMIVLMVRKSRPAGVRFDKNPSSGPLPYAGM